MMNWIQIALLFFALSFSNQNFAYGEQWEEVALNTELGEMTQIHSDQMPEAFEVEDNSQKIHITIQGSESDLRVEKSSTPQK